MSLSFVRVKRRADDRAEDLLVLPKSKRLDEAQKEIKKIQQGRNVPLVVATSSLSRSKEEENKNDGKSFRLVKNEDLNKFSAAEAKAFSDLKNGINYGAFKGFSNNRKNIHKKHNISKLARDFEKSTTLKENNTDLSKKTITKSQNTNSTKKSIYKLIGPNSSVSGLVQVIDVDFIRCPTSLLTEQQKENTRASSIACNGEAMKVISGANGDSDDEAKYVYDIYTFDASVKIDDNTVRIESGGEDWDFMHEYDSDSDVDEDDTEGEKDYPDESSSTDFENPYSSDEEDGYGYVNRDHEHDDSEDSDGTFGYDNSNRYSYDRFGSTFRPNKDEEDSDNDIETYKSHYKFYNRF